MKRRINLFSQRKENQTILNVFRYGIRATFGVLAFGAIILLVIVGSYLYFNIRIRDLSNKKVTYEKYILSHTGFSQDIEHFVTKYRVLQNHLSTDANGYAYLEKFKSILEPLGLNQTIESFEIDNQRNASFSVSVGQYEEGLRILALFEDPNILEEFESLQLDSFKISDRTAKYSLFFNGKMKLIQ